MYDRESNVCHGWTVLHGQRASYRMLPLLNVTAFSYRVLLLKCRLGFEARLARYGDPTE